MAEEPRTPLTKEQIRLLNFIYEVTRLRFTQRSWISKIGLPFGFAANDAEHTFNTITLAVLLGSMMGLSEQEIERISFLAWIHDITEVRTGDFDPNSRMYVTDEHGKVMVNEALAAKGIFEGTPLYDMAMRALEECKAKATLASKIVKDADILDTVRELIEMAAKGIRYYERNAPRLIKKLDAYHTEPAKYLHHTMVQGGPEVIWDHFLNEKSTFTEGRYAK